MKAKKTKKYNYFYYGMPISKVNFLKSVPEKWEDWVVDGNFSWCGYDAVEIDKDEKLTNTITIKCHEIHKPTK